MKKTERRDMWTSDKLEQILCEPSARLIEDIAKIDGDIMVLGAGGKMGPTLCMLAANAVRAAEGRNRVIAVSRFSDPQKRAALDANGVETVSADLRRAQDIARLPDAANIVFMAGRKFGTDGEEPLTWGMNAAVPVLVLERFHASRFVVFSSGNVYDLVPPASGGSLEDDTVRPIGEYTQSVLARERIFQFYAATRGTKCLIFRLNYAIALEYGVLADIARAVAAERPLSLSNPCFNCIWQGDANEFALRSLLLAANPPRILNVTGPETAGLRATALAFGCLLGKEVRFEGEEPPTAYLSNAGEAMAAFGYPRVSLDTMIRWQAEWIADGCADLGKPTHFEQRAGSY